MPCSCLTIHNGEKNLKQVHVGIKNNSAMGYGDISILYSDEIGVTPEQAITNEKTR